jgi:hypothetical protein
MNFNTLDEKKCGCQEEGEKMDEDIYDPLAEEEDWDIEEF